ncbi:hypothetical protein CR513_06625, partial [Mucuna pruriens]
MSSIRIVLSLAATFDLEVEQMDVKTAFLHGDLEEEIYMKQPDGFQISGKEDYVCRLKKSLYGLKQAPRQWYKKFESVMCEQGYKKTTSDHCVFVRKILMMTLLSCWCETSCLYNSTILVLTMTVEGLSIAILRIYTTAISSVGREYIRGSEFMDSDFHNDRHGRTTMVHQHWLEHGGFSPPECVGYTERSSLITSNFLVPSLHLLDRERHYIEAPCTTEK